MMELLFPGNKFLEHNFNAIFLKNVFLKNVIYTLIL